MKKAPGRLTKGGRRAPFGKQGATQPPAKARCGKEERPHSRPQKGTATKKGFPLAPLFPSRAEQRYLRCRSAAVYDRMFHSPPGGSQSRRFLSVPPPAVTWHRYFRRHPAGTATASFWLVLATTGTAVASFLLAQFSTGADVVSFFAGAAPTGSKKPPFLSVPPPAVTWHRCCRRKRKRASAFPRGQPSCETGRVAQKRKFSKQMQLLNYLLDLL